MNNDAFLNSLDSIIFDLQDKTDEVVRRTMIKLLEGVVLRSAVGNPDIWAVNKGISNYNNAVAEHNAALRNNPETSTATKRGRRINKGLKLNDSIDIIKPDGYTGGRYRGNWQVFYNVTTTTETGRIDKSGAETLTAGREKINSFTVAGNHKIWIVNNVPYAMKLEFGHSKQQPTGNVRIAVNDFPRLLEESINEVKEK